MSAASNPCVGCVQEPGTLGQGALVLLGTMLTGGCSAEDIRRCLCADHAKQIADGLAHVSAKRARRLS